MAMSTDPLIGKTLGDYSIVDILGHGGMARVYRGYDKKLNRYAAVKVIDAHLIVSGDQDEYRQRFQNEARAIARLNHPNIVGVYQFDQVGTIYYMAMSFIDGRDLRAHLKDYAKKNTFMPYPEVLRIIRDISSALDYAHREGVIHRDIKPSNIMVTSEGRAVLTDFGLALSVPEGTVGNTFGSAHYIAPEQAVSSAQAVPQSDLYSLGVVLFEMLANHVPFNDQNAMSVALKHLNEQPQPPSRTNPNLSPRVDQVVLKALDKAPAKRYENGFVLAQALQFAFSIADDTDPLRKDKIPVAGLPSWDSPDRPAVEMEAIDGSTTGRQEIVNALEPSRLNALDDSPTVTDSKKSEATRRGILQAQQSRAQRNRLLGGLAVIGVGAVVALVLLINSSSGAVANQNATASAIAQAAIIAASETANSVGATSNSVSAAFTSTAQALALPVSPTGELTPEATSEPTDAPTATVPTDTPATTDTPAPTTTIPTDTPPPTDTPIPSSTPTDTPAPIIGSGDPAEQQVILRYDGNSFVLLNRSYVDVDVSGLRFVQTNADGDELVFETRLWAGGSRPTSDLPGGDCFEVLKDTQVGVVGDPPDYCGRRHAWARVSFVRWFWLSSDADATFEVRRGDALLATCPVKEDGAEAECPVDVRRGP